MLRYLCIIQARMTSTRLPGKVMMTVGGVPIVKRVWDAAKACRRIGKVIVAWPERYDDLDQNDVRERFRRISREFPSKYIIRLTADCPLLTPAVIDHAISEFERRQVPYYCNRDTMQDGFDVQIFTSFMLHHDYATHKEHVIKPETHATPDKYMSVDTAEDLARVRGFINER